MRKYQQLALLLLACVSVAALILYRKQYVELRSTFEDFNIFGSSRSSQKCMVFNETLNVRDVDLSYALSGWSKLQDGFYAYSAYWYSNGISKAIGLGPKGKVPLFKCHIWHSYRNELFSNSGSFDFHEIIVPNSTFSVFEFLCDISSQKIKGSPYMFVTIVNNDKRFIPITAVKTKRKKDSVAMCVYPDYTGISGSSILEFFGYHEILGFTDFFIYDAMHYKLLLKVKGVVSTLGWVQLFDLLPWHFPLNLNDPSAKIALELDCAHRVSNKVLFSTINSFNDYVVPSYQKKIVNIVNNTDSAIAIVRHQICCSDLKSYTHSDKSWPLILKQNQCFDDNSRGKSVMINPQLDTYISISMTSLAILSYRPCTKHERTLVSRDLSSRKFLGELLQSKIILLWNSGSFF